MSSVFHVGDNHKFVQVPEDFLVFDEQPDKVSGVKIVPRIIVGHYGVTRTHKELTDALVLNDYVSAHLSITVRGSERRLTQHVPFNIQAGHAGKEAVWRGKWSVNSFSIGIEINNPGPLFESKDGWVDIRGKRWNGEVLVALHNSGRFKAWTAWAKYTIDEISAFSAICLALKEKYPTIEDIVGHDEIRTDKADPGPAFPMREVRRLVLPEA